MRNEGCVHRFTQFILDRKDYSIKIYACCEHCGNYKVSDKIKERW